MPRVEHRKAAKDYPDSNIKKGEKYFTWKFRFGGRRRQKDRPLPEQLTQSGYLQEWYPLQREIESFDGSADDLNTLVERVRDLGQEEQDKLENMPESLQDGPSGEILRERSEECEERVSTLEDLHSRLEEVENASSEETDGNGKENADSDSDGDGDGEENDDGDSDGDGDGEENDDDDADTTRDDIISEIQQAAG